MSADGNEDSEIVVQPVNNKNKCFQLRIPVENLHCYSCQQTFDSLHHFQTHHNSSRSRSHHKQKASRRTQKKDDYFVKSKKQDFSSIVKQENEDKENLSYPVDSQSVQLKLKCLENRDKISVSCHICSSHFSSLQNFLAHLNDTNESQSNSKNISPEPEPEPESNLISQSCKIEPSKYENSFCIDNINNNDDNLPISRSRRSRTKNYFYDENYDDDGIIAEIPSPGSGDLDYDPDKEQAEEIEEEGDDFVADGNSSDDNSSDVDFNPTTTTITKTKPKTAKRTKTTTTSKGRRKRMRDGGKVGSDRNYVYPKVTCDLCQQEFTNRFTLKTHMLRAHTKPDDLFKCPHCRKIFGTAPEFDRHTSRLTYDPPKPCTKPNCVESFTAKCALKFHLRKVHAPGKEDEESTLDMDICPICGKGVKGDGKAIRIHLARHQELDSGQIYECSQCPKKFNLKKSLKSHETSVHKKVKNFLCSLCGKAWPTKNKLAIHSRVHTGEKPYLCTKCPQAFTTPTSLRCHSNIHLEDKAFKCPVPGCSSSFAIKQTLKRHLQIHTGVKPYGCKFCSETFPDNRPLKKHVSRHHENCDFDMDAPKTYQIYVPPQAESSISICEKPASDVQT